MRHFHILAAALAPLFVASLALAQGTQKDDPGELAFNGVCGTCHTLRPGDNRLGPHLNGVIGRKAGGVSDYGNYSSGMTQSGITWDEATLDKFVANPDSVVPGNGMKPFAGVPDADQRAKIVAFIAACHQCGPQCPAPKKCTKQEGAD